MDNIVTSQILFEISHGFYVNFTNLFSIEVDLFRKSPIPNLKICIGKSYHE